MGPQHERIIHAHFDRTDLTLTLQYSPLYSFELKETAPLTLFFQYIMSSPRPAST